MPIRISDALPAAKTLEMENIFYMTEQRALSQDIRPLEIMIVNLMPTKIQTETQLLRLLSNTPLQVNITLVHTASHESKNIAKSHLDTFYLTFDEISHRKFDGMIVTGAPVEMMPFEEVDYWPELCRIFEWSRTHVYSSLFICWAAQAALYVYHGINKYPLKEKMFGVFDHKTLLPFHPLVRGFNDRFYAPHSRHTGIDEEAVAKDENLIVLAKGETPGPLILAHADSRRFYVTGHLEYDTETLAGEYERDLNRGLSIRMPDHYFQNDDPSMQPVNRWKCNANLLFGNWLNYFVYQNTPFDLEKI